MKEKDNAKEVHMSVSDLERLALELIGSICIMKTISKVIIDGDEEMKADAISKGKEAFAQMTKEAMIFFPAIDAILDGNFEKKVMKASFEHSEEESENDRDA